MAKPTVRSVGRPRLSKLGPAASLTVRLRPEDRERLAKICDRLKCTATDGLRHALIVAAGRER